MFKQFHDLKDIDIKKSIVVFNQRKALLNELLLVSKLTKKQSSIMHEMIEDLNEDIIYILYDIRRMDFIRRVKIARRNKIKFWKEEIVYDYAILPCFPDE